MTRLASSRTTLDGWRVLLPRSDGWAPRAQALLTERGATVVTSSLLASAPPPDPHLFARALLRLERGDYDWVMVSSSSGASALTSRDLAIPSSTRLAAVGEATADALRERGLRASFVATAAGSGDWADEWLREEGAGSPQRVLVVGSDIAPLSLGDALAAHGHEVDTVIAYSTVLSAPDPELAAKVHGGTIDAVFVTSGSVARAVVRFFAPLPETVAVVTIGPATTREAEAAGLSVASTAKERSVEGLVAALESLAAGYGAPAGHG